VVSAALLFAGQRLPGLVLAWFLLAMFPTLALVPLNQPLSEQRAALALILPLFYLAWLGSALFTEGRPKYLVPLVLLLWSSMAVAQSWPWRSEVALWEWQARVENRSPRAWSFLANAYSQHGDLKEAASAIDKAIVLSPGNPLHYSLAARIALDRGDLIASSSYLRAGLRIESELADLHLIATELEARRGNLLSALEHASVAIRLAPEASGAWNARGNVRWLIRDYSGAEEDYRQALARDPENEEARVNLRRLRQALQ
jgi:tetratricopeptide (TPR) repeat protein